jgi:acetyltransferase-like isoleucine patch superfamily enzyme
LVWIFEKILAIVSVYRKISLWTKIYLYRRMGAKIGENVRLFGGIDGVNPHLVTIGDHSVIGKGSMLTAHCPIRGPKPVTIGSYVWMGFAVTVLPGVTVGDYCVIGAGSVVTRDIPPYSIAAGNPARVLRQRDPSEVSRTADLLRDGSAIGRDGAPPF